MANLLSIAEQAWRQLFPNPGDETALKKEEFIAAAKTEYAYQLWLKIKQDKREYGECEIPSYLLSETVPPLDVVDNQVDISSLKIMRSIDQELWLQNVGGVVCECRYVKSTINHTQLMCDDDSLGDNDRTYYVVGKKIVFPRGTHKSTIAIIYANSGEEIDGRIEVDDMIAGVVRRTLIEIFGGKIGVEDKVNESNSNVKQ